MSDQLKKTMATVLSSFIGRVVLALYTLLIVPLLPSIINFTNNVLGYNLTDSQVQSYANKGTLAIGGLAAVWLLNHGLFERAALNASKELVKDGIAVNSVTIDKK